MELCIKIHPHHVPHLCKDCDLIILLQAACSRDSSKSSLRPVAGVASRKMPSWPWSSTCKASSNRNPLTGRQWCCPPVGVSVCVWRAKGWVTRKHSASSVTSLASSVASCPSVAASKATDPLRLLRRRENCLAQIAEVNPVTTLLIDG